MEQTINCNDDATTNVPKKRGRKFVLMLTPEEKQIRKRAMHREYYQADREERNSKALERYHSKIAIQKSICLCGGKYTPQSERYHKFSIKHTKWAEAQQQQNQNEFLCPMS